MTGENVGVWGWDTANDLWRKILVDGTGRLIIVTAAGVGIDTHCHGWDGAAWQELLVESAVQKNLRTSLYVGGTQISVTSTANDARPTTYNALVTGAWLFGFNGTTWDRLRMESAAFHNLRVALYSSGGLVSVTATSADARPTTYTALVTGAWLFGFNGTTWDRLRSYGTGILKVGRAEVGLLDVRMTAVGQVGAAGARKLYWLACNPSAGNSVWEITDDTDGSTAIRLDCFSTTREAKGFIFDPPMEFTNGIYLKTFTNMTSCIFGYL